MITIKEAKINGNRGLSKGLENQSLITDPVSKLPPLSTSGREVVA